MRQMLRDGSWAFGQNPNMGALMRNQSFNRFISIRESIQNLKEYQGFKTLKSLIQMSFTSIMLTSAVAGISCLTWTSRPAFAQEKSSTTADLPKSTTEVQVPAQESTSRISPVVGFKSYNDTARSKDYADKKLKTYKGKQEFYAGAKNSQWGGFVTVVQNYTSYNSESTNVSGFRQGDGSLTLIHPNWFQDETLLVSGLARAYLPMSQRSQDLNVRHYAYYLNHLKTISSNLSLLNIFVPRYFTQSKYADTDTRTYFEDRTVLTAKANSWFRYGISQWSQYEIHQKSDDGFCSEIIPFVDFVLNKNAFMSTRLSLPVYSRNAVYDGPTSAKIDNAAAELYFELKL